jgi:hypothetical protein
MSSRQPVAVTAEEALSARNVTADSLATQCGVDVNGPIEGDTSSEQERVQRLTLQVCTPGGR